MRGTRRLLLGLHAGAVGVGPLVLIAVAAGAEEGRGLPGALVVGLVTACPPGVALRVGHRLAGLVADEVLLVLHVGPAGDLAAAAARPRLDRVADGGAAAGEVGAFGA